VPPVLRNLRKCEACGFPVSAERTLCVECEEKKWRGVPKRTNSDLQRTSGQSADLRAAGPSAVSAPKIAFVDPSGTDSVATDAKDSGPASEAPSAPVAHLMNAAAKSVSVAVPKPPTQEVVPLATVSSVATPATLPEAKPNQPIEAKHQSLTPSVADTSTKEELASKPAETASEMASTDFVLSAGLEPSQSWLATNKYIVLVIVVIAAAVAAFVFLH
jgi:hypothetical protein